KLFQYKKSGGTRGKIGLPLGLNMYENLSFWHTLLSEVGFEVVVSGLSTRKTYTKGQHTIPSDTVCYPAKLMHGHIEELIDLGINTIFYPCMTYNFDEGMGDNHYNCPVVAYYPELLNANIDKLGEIKFLAPFFAPHHRRMFEKKIAEYFKEQFGVSKKETLLAVDKAYKEYANYKKDIYQFGQDAINYARENGRQIIVLCGRPYHIDPEINHGIDRLITSLGLVVISEDCLDLRNQKYRVNVLNQWTYHSRLYGAAKYVGQEDDMFLVQLVSFGCGLDAITTDEVRDILQENDKIYTQIKIDEISNLGAAKIRLRSLIETVKPQGK
ncbi:MAG: 2-hydroxyacyl-CoA dehydratase, partial [Oscillospiraceae bacterium]|nr:2-hydroxyacyl-CoA dehydratase [Oscillospiraceae bacterium]